MSDDPTPKPDDPKSDDQALGDAGKKALDQERTARREAEAKAKELEARLQSIEDKDKSEVERLTEQVATLTKDLSTASTASARMKVALDKGLTATQAKRLVGTTEEELSADADELLADLGATPGSEKKDPPPGGRPDERLLPGNGDPDAPVEETDVQKLGARMFER